MDKRWPDFTVADLRSALAEFERRERTRGALPQDSTAQNSAA
jgi:undecaprenyl pyrophosphate synthase